MAYKRSGISHDSRVLMACSISATAASSWHNGTARHGIWRRNGSANVSGAAASQKQATSCIARQRQAAAALNVWQRSVAWRVWRHHSSASTRVAASASSIRRQASIKHQAASRRQNETRRHHASTYARLKQLNRKHRKHHGMASASRSGMVAARRHVWRVT